MTTIGYIIGCLVEMVSIIVIIGGLSDLNGNPGLSGVAAGIAGMAFGWLLMIGSYCANRLEVIEKLLQAKSTTGKGETSLAT